MALTLKQVTVTTSAQSLSTLCSLATGRTAYGFRVQLVNGSANIGYVGDSTVTNAPANAGGTFTATVPYVSPEAIFAGAVSLDRTFLVCSANTTAHITLLE